MPELPPPTPSPVPRRWRDDPSERAGASGLDGPDRRVIYGLLAAILALGGAVVGLLNWIRPIPSPFFVPIRVGEYQDRQIPFLPFAGDDAAALGRGYFARTVGLGFPDQEKAVIAATLAGLRERRARDAVVVLVSANARVADDGSVAILPADADPAVPQTWLPLRDILVAVRDCPAAHKLLILDIMRPLGPSRMGVLLDDVPARIPDELSAVADPRRLVLSACGPGQVSFASEELGRSVFSYYLEEGLRGWADDSDGRDGLICAVELGRFVADRVARWVRLNRGAVQVPAWSGSGEDFPLVAMAHSRPRAHLTVPKPPAYPGWLRDAWTRRDLWRKADDDNLLPRAYLKAEAGVLEAEAEWRGGLPSARTRHALDDRLASAQTRFDQARPTGRPEPRSLAMASAFGAIPDPAVAKALSDLLAKRAAALRATAAKPDPAADPAKLADAFHDATKGASDFALARAIFDAALGGDGRGDSLVFLDDLLRHRHPRPLYAETLMLWRLAKLAREATPDRDAPTPDAALHGLRLAREAEAAESRPIAFNRLRKAFDDAARTRHDGEVLLLFARGYAPIDEAVRSMDRAIDAYQAISEGQGAITLAFAEIDEALRDLPAYRPYLEILPERVGAWLDAVAVAGDLADLLAGTVATPTPGSPELGPRQALDDLRHKIDVLRARLDDLRSPFAPARVADLFARAARADAGPDVLRELDAGLATPFPDAPTRIRLRAARGVLARALLDRSLAVDRGTRPDPGADGPRAPAPDPARDAARRARESIAALGLAGLDPSEVSALQAAYDRDLASRGHPEAWRALARDIDSAWRDRLTGQFREQTNLVARDRMSRFFPPFAPSPLLDDPLANPTLQRREAAMKALLGWLADRAEDHARDLGGSTFDAITARTYRPRDDGRADRPAPVQFLPSSSGAPSLTAARPVATVPFGFRLAPAPGQAPTFALIHDPEWLLVDPGGGAVRSDVGSDDRSIRRYQLPASDAPDRSVPLRIELRTGAGRSETPPPRGLLARVRSDGRDFHSLLDVDLTSDADRPQVLFAASPDRPADPRDAIRLRAVDGLQPWYLYIRNPSRRARSFGVRILAAGSPVLGGEGTVKLEPGAIGKVAFAAPVATAPAPATATTPAELPELAGPLAVRLADAEAGGAELVTVPVDVGIASPGEVARVTSIRFDPGGASGKNHLEVTLRAAGPIAGPPCVVRLVLDRDRIPALLRPGDGTFRAVLPADGRPITLDAKGIGLDPAADPDGLAVIALDHFDRAFAFRTTFMTGSPTPRTPEPVALPALRLRADRFAGGASSTLKVTIEADNAPPGTTLDLVLGRFDAGVFRPDLSRTYPSTRRTRIGLAVGGVGDPLTFSASVADWGDTLDIGGLRGTRLLRARLLDPGGHAIQEATQTVVFDDIPPGQPRFVGLPAQVKKGTTLAVTAIASPSESGIASASFFVGKPVDGKIPPGIVPVDGSSADARRSTWTAGLPLPGERKGPIDLSARFTNAAGVSAFASGTVELLDADPVLPGSIRGSVVEGSNPQPNLEVTLAGPVGSGPTSTKTAADGTFTFSGLAPGKYKLSASKPESLTKASAEVTVAPGVTATPALELFR